MNGQIFISYRRDDSSAWARLVYDRLSQYFSNSEIFIDIDAIKPGVDFVKAIEASVGSSDVLIAVIGKRWLISSNEKGSRRLDDPDDFVRLEIATALKCNIQVVPVLVDGASIPRSNELPEDLKLLVRRQALDVSNNRFNADVERLIVTLERDFEKADASLIPFDSDAYTEAKRLIDAEEYPKGLKLFKIAALRNRDAMVDLAFWFQEGRRGLEQDYVEARRLYEEAAKAGKSEAMKALGDLYANGWGVPQVDLAQARHWYIEAVEAGNNLAVEKLAELYINGGPGLPPDYTKAREWYQKAAAAGNTSAMSLGLLYGNGRGVAQDYDQAHQWYQKAADAGNMSAMNNLGLLYEHGRGVAQDYGQARDWYQKAAAAGSTSAMNNFGLLCEHGRGVARDYGQAREWYQKAANAGDADAKRALSRWRSRW
jgi:TPR repeat protein